MKFLLKVLLSLILKVVFKILAALNKIKELFKEKYFTIKFRNQCEVVKRKQVEKKIGKIVSDSRNLKYLQIKVKWDRKITSKLDNEKCDKLKRNSATKEIQIKKIMTIILSEQFKKMMEEFNFTANDKIDIIFRSIADLSNNDEYNTEKDECLICCVLDKNKFCFTVPIKKQIVLDLIAASDPIGLTNREIDSNLISYEITIHDIKDKQWIKEIFIPNLTVNIVLKKDDAIDSLDLELFSSLWHWTIGLA